MQNEIRILGVHIKNRTHEAVKIQDILTKYGCSIKTRLGLHEVTEDHCSTQGIIILELTGDTQECIKLENELHALDGVEVKKMLFEY